MMTFVLLLAALLGTPEALQAPDYAALYARGLVYTDFLAGATARAAAWRRNSADAVVTDEAIAKVTALPAPRKLLVVTESSCSDSVSTIPYLARLVERAGGRLEMRLVDSRQGRAVMEAHRTPDGRAATPTVVVLGPDGAFLAAWVERPVALQEWHAERQATSTARDLLPAKMQWYEADAGRSAIAELVALITG